MQQNNNVASTQIAALNFQINPPTIPPAADYTQITYPALGAGCFCYSDKDYGTQQFLIYDNNDGSGSNIQAGTFNAGLQNFGIIGVVTAQEVFSVYDTTG